MSSQCECVSTKITSITEEVLSPNRGIGCFMSKIYGHALTQKQDFLGFRNLHVLKHSLLWNLHFCLTLHYYYYKFNLFDLCSEVEKRVLIRENSVFSLYDHENQPYTRFLVLWIIFVLNCFSLSVPCIAVEKNVFKKYDLLH